MKTDNTTVELRACQVRFYSDCDERAFFDWISRLDSIEGFNGVGDEILLRVNRDRLDELQLRELLSLFWRYKIDMSQLAVFNTEAFSAWFENPVNYWYEQTFCKKFAKGPLKNT